MANLNTLKMLARHTSWRVSNEPSDLIDSAKRFAWFTGDALTKELSRRRFDFKQPYIAHTAIHTTGNNIGDMALPIAIRKVIDHELGDQNWYLQPLWREHTEAVVDRFNDTASLMIIGGGGLLLPDNKLSGWQWNISMEELERLTTPFCLFAVGYNQFRGGNHFDSIFKKHVELTTEKSVFVGLRNGESLERLAEYLPDSLRAKLRVQPCITTVLSKFYPTYKSELRNPEAKELAINACFDRPDHRFKEGQDAAIAKLVEVGRWAIKEGWKIHLTYHGFEDALLSEAYKEAGIPFEGHWLPRQNPEAVFDFYTKIPLVLGMRGHAQMIPYGLGNMILPIITHNKLIYMLKEFDMDEWGAELETPDFVENITSQIKVFDADRKKAYNQIEVGKERLWALTKSNIQELAQVIR